jgi:hypothetical protein
LPGITIDHRPDERSKHEQNAQDSKDNCRVSEKQYLNQNENDAENKEAYDFPSCQPGKVMPEEEKREANNRIFISI